MILTCYLSDHSLGDSPVGQEGLNLLFDHSTVPPASREENLLFTTKYNKRSHLQQNDITNVRHRITFTALKPAVALQSIYTAH